MGSEVADESNLNEAILAWARTRPNWEQTALGMLARGQAITDDALRRLADEAEAQAGETDYTGSPIAAADLGPSGETTSPVRLVAVKEPRAVNALASDDGIAFEADGITLIFGHNGSGKSGYARVLKTMTRAREEIQVLGDVFAPEAKQSAEVSILIGTSASTLQWPMESAEALRRVSFYDSACAARYVNSETEVAYRPWAITLMDKPFSVSGKVRAVLEARRESTSLSPIKIVGVHPESRSGQFLRSLSTNTTTLEIDIAQEVPGDIAERLASLRERIETLRARDPEGRKVELQRILSAMDTIKTAITASQMVLTKLGVDRLRAAADTATATRANATRVSELRFKGEALPGVGDPVWMALWESARRFSEAIAYPGHDFPHVHSEPDPARCVLCHQSLNSEAKERLRRFDAFVTDDSEQAASKAEAERERLTAPFRDLAVSTTPVTLAMQRLEPEPAATAQARQAISLLNERRDAVLNGLAGKGWPDDEGATIDIGELDAAEHRLRHQLKDLEGEDLGEQAVALESEERELLSRAALGPARGEIEEQIGALQRQARIDEAIRITDTRGITRRATELTRSHVSEVMKHRFSQETLLLGLTRVRLGDAGGGQGNLRHRAQFVDAVHPASVAAVLSEGEQTALGLAGFLTEVESDPSRSAAVFDDPVSSLDHVRQEKVAQRLVQLAQSRQVIVFTHDVGFVVDIKRAAEADGQVVAERQVTRNQGRPGHVTANGPWEGLTVSQRLANLENRIATIKTITDPTDQSREIRHWYQDLRLVWERSLEEAVLDKVVARSRLELRPSGLTGLAQITPDDDQEFQASFTRCGDRGSHDRSTYLNRPVPPIDELRDDLTKLRAWNKRIKAYR